MNKNYLNYLIKNRKVLILFFLAVYLCVCLTWNLSAAGTAAPGYGYYSAAKAAIAISIVLCYALPVLLFSYVHQRSSADLYFALPVSRKEQRITTLVFAFKISFGYFLITMIAAWLLFGIGIVPAGRVLECICFAAFLIITLLSFNTMLYLFANNLLDGIVTMAAYTMFPVVGSMAESIIVSNIVAGGTPAVKDGIFVFLSPVLMLIRNFAATVSMNGWLFQQFNIPYLILSAAYLVLSWLVVRKHFDERQSERAGQISDHPLTYPTIINLYAVIFLLVFGSYLVIEPGPELIVMYIFLLVCYVAGSFLYRRKLKVDAKMIGTYVLEAVLCAGLMFIGWKTQGFGAARAYSLTESRQIVYQYNMQAERENLGQSTAADQNAYVMFSIAADTDGNSGAEEFKNLMENYRSRAIDEFYEGQKDGVMTGSFQVYMTNDNGSHYENSYFYNPSVPFTEEELKQISKYGDVEVYVYDENFEEETYLLDDYLKKRESLR